MDAMALQKFAEQNSCDKWELDGDGQVVYFGAWDRVRVSCERYAGLEFKAGLAECDYGVKFADQMVDAIRENLSPHLIYMLMLRLAKELSAWQQSDECNSQPDICSEFISEVGRIKGFENKELQAAIRIVRQYRNAGSNVEEARALIELNEFAIGNADEVVPEPIIRQRDAEIKRLRCAIESLCEYKSMVVDVCGEMGSAGEYRDRLREMSGQKDEMAAAALRYRSLRRVNVPQFQELFRRSIVEDVSFDSLVDELHSQVPR